jgi:hypothetical protein
MRSVVAVLLVAACSKEPSAPSREVTVAASQPTAGHQAVPPATPAQRPYAVGDKVVLMPTNILVISAIGTRKDLTPKDVDNVDFQPGNALAGKDTMKVVEPDDTRVYALRFPAEDHDSFLLEVERAGEEHLRHISTPEQIDAFLRTLHETTVASRKPGFRRPDNVLRSTLGANNNLQELARFYPLLDRSGGVEADIQRSLETFFIDEISTVKTIATGDARAMLEAAQ